jgi:hypothetical protein
MYDLSPLPNKIQTPETLPSSPFSAFRTTPPDLLPLSSRGRNCEKRDAMRFMLVSPKTEKGERGEKRLLPLLLIAHIRREEKKQISTWKK